ncbi:hypothetical protein QOZ80_9AG0685600 [Eleusine coracana subsp. coracana]|nr:hypothetical protein QOZ80_9AG0685600 [Eleusine coracana subsp. coracana]
MASSGRRGRRRNRGWSYPRKNRPRAPPSSPSPSPESAAGASSAAGYGGLPLPPGTEVEVRVDDDGFHGSWFEACIVDFSPARGRREPARYTVTYSHLLADDGGGVLAEHFPPSHIRPRPPPPVGPAPPFRLDDLVEAFHNDGWWSGIVVAAPAPAPAGPTPATVTVAFPITREVIPFPPHLVRPRRDFVNGEWVPSRAVVAVRPKRAVKAYNVGDKVEVGRDREVFGYSWFPATVAKVVDPLSYVVEYFDQEVEGDAGAEKATEYLHWRFIRPAVEHVPLESEFQLAPGAAVEAYCDGAWSPGIVRRVVGDGEFEVSVDGKEKEVPVNKVVELLKPQYSWNGKQWRIVSAKKQANLRRRSMSGRSPNSPVDVASSGDEHSAGNSCDTLSIAELRNKMASANSAGQQTQERLLSVKALKVKKDKSNSDRRKTHPFVELQEKHGASDNSQLIKNGSAGRKEIICALAASVHCQASSMLDKQVSSQTRSGLHTKVPKYKTLAKKKGSKELSSLHSSLNADSTVQHRGRENLMSINSCTEQDLDRSLEDTYQELFPLIPPGFESMYNAEGIDIRDSLLDEELTNGLSQADRNGMLPTDHAAIQLAKSSQEYSLEMREGMALGLMVAFATLVENFLQSRLTKMLQIKSNCSKYLGEMNKLDAEMVGKTTSLSRMDALLDQKDEAIGQLEQRLAHLRQETQQIEKDREHEDAELSRLKSKHSRFEEAFGEGEQQFRNLLADLRHEKLP